MAMTTAVTESYDLPALIRSYRSHLSKGRASLGEMLGGHIEVSSEGAWVHTSDGRALLNAGGYGVFFTGARHPIVVEAVSRQLHTHPVATRLLLEPQIARAAEALAEVTPTGLEHVHFANSGAEAVETAIKLARTRGKRHLISTLSGYHGKTLGALSVTAKDVFQEPFRPLLPGVTHVPFGDAAALADALTENSGDACVIIEPVQGEAGVIVPPEGYLRDVELLCRRHGALFVLDEVQTGLGRLGHWWGADREGVTPDILLTGKSLGGGVIPVSAALAKQEVFTAFHKDPFLHTSTFSGSPLAMAAVQGTLRAIKEEGLVERARETGAHLLRNVSQIVHEVLPGVLREVRGAGLLIGIEFSQPGVAGDLLIDLLAQGIITNHSLNSHMVLRLTPPAVMTPRDIAFLVNGFERACRALAERNPNTMESGN